MNEHDFVTCFYCIHNRNRLNDDFPCNCEFRDGDNQDYTCEDCKPEDN